MPAMAMPPMPILLAYSAKMVSGDIEPTVCVIAGFQAFNTWSPHSIAMPGTMIIHTASEPAQIMAAYFNPTIYPSPKTAAPVLILSTSFALSAIVSPQPHTRVVKFSFHHPKVATIKSYRPPMSPAKSNGFAWLPPFSPEISTCVLAVASGKGYSPCFSLTKYLRKGMRNRIPRIPPSKELMNIWKKSTVISGYLS